MMDLAPPPLLLPDYFEGKHPAIIRAEIDPLRYFPMVISRIERRAIVAELRRAGRVLGMMPGTVPVIASKPQAPLVVTYIGTNVSSTDTTSYSFASQGIGPAAADRYVVIGATAHGSSNQTCTITSVSIGGAAGTLHVAPGGAGARANSIASRLVTTGTTATIAVTTTGTAGSMRIFVVTVTGADLTTALDTDGAKLNTSGTTQSVTLDIGRLAFFLGGGNGANLTVSWSSAAVLATLTSESGSSYPASMAYLTGGGNGYTETFTQATAAIRGLAAVSFS